MKTLPFGTMEIEVVGNNNAFDVLALKQLMRESSNNAQHQHENHDSISSELSIDLLLSSKDRCGGDNNEDSKILSSLQSSSSGSCRWNPDDSDYSLNILLEPERASDNQDTDDDDKLETATTVTATTTTSCSTTPSVEPAATPATAIDSLSPSSAHSLFGSDYSLNRARLRVHPNKSRNSKNRALLDASSHHSTISVDSFDTAFSVQSNSHNSFDASDSLPKNIEVATSSCSQPPPAILSSIRHKNNYNSNNGKPKASRDSKVSFYPRVRIQRVPPRNMIPDEQMEAVWYSREEFYVIRKECFRTIRLMKDIEDDDDEAEAADSVLYDEDGEELCRRGLEYKTPKAYKRRQKQKKEVREVVFDELDFQEEQCMNDPLWLAKLSRDQSRSCVDAAIETARDDERQAKQYLQG